MELLEYILVIGVADRRKETAAKLVRGPLIGFLDRRGIEDAAWESRGRPDPVPLGALALRSREFAADGGGAWRSDRLIDGIDANCFAF